MRQAEAAFRIGEAGSARPFLRRVIGAARLDPEAWEEIASGAAGLGQAALVALAAAAASSFAAATVSPDAARESAVSTFASWLLVAALLWSAANVLGHRMRPALALRVVGFAMAPFALLFLAAIPVASVQGAVRLLAVALFLAALVAGTRQALRVETMRASLVCGLAGLGYVLLLLTMVTVTVTITTTE